MPLKWKCPNYFKIFKNDRNVKQISCTKSPGVPFFLSHSTKTTKGWLFKNFLVHFLSNQTSPKFKELTIKQTLQAYTLKSPISGTSPTSENQVILNPTTSGQPPRSHLQVKRVRATAHLRSTPGERPGRGLLQGTLISHDFSSFSIIFSPTKHSTTKLIVHFHNRFLFPPQITPPLKSFVLKEKHREWGKERG